MSVRRGPPTAAPLCPSLLTRAWWGHPSTRTVSLNHWVPRSPGRSGAPAPPHLHLPVLCGVVQGGPAPGVSRDGGAHQQQPVQDGRVAASGCKVQGRGPLVITRGQADVGEGDLGGKGGSRTAEAGQGCAPLEGRAATGRRVWRGRTFRAGALGTEWLLALSLSSPLGLSPPRQHEGT